jgi:serine protease Do
MKKILKLGMIVGMMFVLTGCSTLLNLTTGDLTTSSDVTTNFETSITTTEAPVTTEEMTIDYEQLMDDVHQQVYDRIYNELYNDIKADIVADISEEEIDLIYTSIRDDIINQIELGNIEIESTTIFDQVAYVGVTSALAVVGVNNLDATGGVNSTGSGVIYKRDGDQYYVVTNHHVIEDATDIEIQFYDGTTMYAELLGVETLVDIAVLKFNSTEVLQTANFGDSDALQKGEFITAVGNPSGFDYFNTMTFGVISGVNRYFDIDSDGTRDMFVNYIQHDAAINAGNSGGALFNMYGEIVGINTLKLVDYSIEGMGFAIPSNLIELIVGDIEAFGYSNRKPMLGITFVDIATNRDVLIASGAIIPESITSGFYIQSVVANSSVDGYVLADDIIVQIGDVIIENTAQFVEGFSQYLIGDIIDIVVYRDGQYITLTDIELKGRE